MATIAPMSVYASNVLATVNTGQYEQAMLQTAVKKRISILEYVKKTFYEGDMKLILDMIWENTGVTLSCAQKRISKECILNKKG